MPDASATPLTATTSTPVVPVAASHDAAAPTTAADGRVKLQASTIRPATPQFTEASLRPALTPKIEPVQTWVVESGSPRWLEVRIDRKSVRVGKECRSRWSPYH